MNDLVKATLILGAAIIVSAALWIYFSPYHSCVRAMGDRSELRCAAAVGGGLAGR